MKLGKFMLAAATATLALAPAVSAANPASSLSVSKAVRASAPTAKKNELAGGALIAVIAAAAVVAGIVIVATDDDDDDDSDSN
jgi:hypothetical protein